MARRRRLGYLWLAKLSLLLCSLSSLTTAVDSSALCPPRLTPQNLSVVTVWSREARPFRQFRLSDEDLGGENGFSREPGPSVLLARPPGAGGCLRGICALRLSLNRRKSDDALFYEENALGVPSDSVDLHDDFFCARERGDCDAFVPLFVHFHELDGKKFYAYSFDDSSSFPGYTRESSPLCFAWSHPPSLLDSSPSFFREPVFSSASPLPVNATVSQSRCLQLSAVDNAELRYSSSSASGVYSVGTSVSLRCAEGFSSAGQSVSLCTRDGWYPDGRLGPCIHQSVDPAPSRVSSLTSSSSSSDCALLPAVQGGTVHYSVAPKQDRLPTGSLATVACNFAFTPAGEAGAECRNGTWQPAELAKCYHVSNMRCPPPLPVLNGKLFYSAGRDPSGGPFSMEGVVRVECLGGFHREGACAMMCTESGWTPPSLASCQVGAPPVNAMSSVQCPILRNPGSGRISYTLPLTPTAQGSTAVLICEEGAVPHGSLSSVCLNGEWTNDLGSCGGVDAPATAAGGSTCLPLRAVINGRIQYSFNNMNGAYPVGTVATPTCSIGYQLYGSHAATCLPNGEWSTTSLGNCGPGLPNECPEHFGQDSVVNYNLPTARQGFRRESTIGTMSCTKGSPYGNVVATCVGGTWTPPFGSCIMKARACNSLWTPLHGSIEYSNGGLGGPFAAGTLAKMQCSSNMGAPNGAAVVQCVDGEWESESGDLLGSCPPPATLTPSSHHSHHSGGGLDYEDSLGSSQPIHPVAGTAGAGFCLAPIIPAGGSLAYSATLTGGPLPAGTQVQLACPGSMVVGGGSIAACSGGSWQPPLGSCASSGLGLSQPGFGMGQGLGSSALPMGGVGSALGGAPCALAPMGQAIGANGNSFAGGSSLGSFPSGTTLTIQCPLGHSINGAVVTTCSNGVWTQMGSCAQPDSTCQPFGALQVGTISDGELRYSNQLHSSIGLGTVVRVNCSLGYRVEGPPAAVCTSAGWQPHNIGSCVMNIGEFQGSNSCGDAPLVLNGQVAHSTGAPHPVGSIATVACSFGYDIAGESVLTCITGRWSPPSFGYCQPRSGFGVSSGTPGLGGGSIMPGQNIAGGSIPPGPSTFGTLPGQSTLGTTQTALTGSAFPSSTTSTQKQPSDEDYLDAFGPEQPTTGVASGSGTCSFAPLAPSNGELIFRPENSRGPWPTGTIVALNCAPGYRVSGAAASTCQLGSFIPSSIGSCIDSAAFSSRSPCRAPSTPLGGHLNFSTSATSSGTFPDGAMVALFCSGGSAPSISSCSNGLWTPALSTCTSFMQRDQRSQTNGCQVLRAPPNGEITFSLESSSPSAPSIYPVGTRASLACGSGSRIQGSPSSVCTSFGDFSPPLGTCVEVRRRYWLF